MTDRITMHNGSVIEIVETGDGPFHSRDLYADVLKLGQECESAITGMPAEIESVWEALDAIRAELSYGRKAYQDLRRLENELRQLSQPREFV